VSFASAKAWSRMGIMIKLAVRSWIEAAAPGKTAARSQIPRGDMVTPPAVVR
jgi:hypothetical protein